MTIPDYLEVVEITKQDEHLLPLLVKEELVHVPRNAQDLIDHRLAARKNDKDCDKHCYGLFYKATDGERKLAAVVYTALQKLPTANDHADYEKLPGDITAIRDKQVSTVRYPNTMVFYSVSNFRVPELAGQQLGNFVIEGAAKKVEELGHNIQTYTTLSPLRNFPRWLRQQATIDPSVEAKIMEIAGSYGNYINAAGFLGDVLEERFRIRGRDEAKLTDILEELATDYLINHHSQGDGIMDSVQKFHMKSGAIIGGVRVNLNPAAGQDKVMVNYVRNLPNKEEYSSLFAQESVCMAKYIPEHIMKHDGAVGQLESMTSHLRQIDNEIVAYQGGK